MSWRAYLLCIVLLCVLSLVAQLDEYTKEDLVKAVFGMSTEIPEHLATTAGLAELAGAVPVWLFWREAEPDAIVPDIVKGAVGSCARFFDADRGVRLVVVSNVSRWLSQVHPNFRLVTRIDQSDYSRIELIAAYGGVYMDTDMVCMHDPVPRIKEALAKFPVTQKGDAKGFRTSLMGPFRPRSELAQRLHRQLWKTMDKVAKRLHRCRLRQGDGRGGILYQNPRGGWNGNCIGWGSLVDPSYPVWKQAIGDPPDLSRFNDAGALVADGAPCHFNVSRPDYRSTAFPEGVDIVHVGLSCGDNKKWDSLSLEDVCGARSEPVAEGKASLCEALRAGLRSWQEGTWREAFE